MSEARFGTAGHVQISIHAHGKISQSYWDMLVSECQATFISQIHTRFGSQVEVAAKVGTVTTYQESDCELCGLTLPVDDSQVFCKACMKHLNTLKIEPINRQTATQLQALLARIKG